MSSPVKASELELRPGVFTRLVAAAYDAFQAKAEREVFAGHRRELLRSAEGRVLEMSTGTGANYAHYRKDVRLDLVALEPDPGMLARAVKKARQVGLHVEFDQSGAYPLPFEDESFDVAVYCLCLCTIPDAGRALGEARRVLRPGGRLLFLEHVRSSDPGLARWQDRLRGPWKVFALGCNCNRETLALIEASGLSIEEIHKTSDNRIPIPIVRPLIIGVARKPGVM